MIIAFTGHRPNKLGGYKQSALQNWIKQQIKLKLQELKPDKVISGGALGVDQWAAYCSIELGIPFIIAQPFKEQDKVWPEQSKKEFKNLLDKAEKVVIVCEGDYSPEKMQIRNEWMVDNCDKLIAVWDGSKGGTGNCVNYAIKQNKEIIRINPKCVQQ